MRLTINKSNQTYLKTLAQAWALSEKEALNYLLNKLRIEGLGTTIITPTVTEEISTSNYQETAAEEFVEPAPDPFIQRLLELGVVEEF